MNKTPSILVDTGFEVDQNGALTELDFPNVVETLDPPKQIKFSGTTMNWIPSNAATLEGIEAKNITVIPYGSRFSDYTKLAKVRLDSCVSIGSNDTARAYSGNFKNCTALTELYLPECVSILMYTSEANAGEFRGCTSLVTLNLPKCETLYEGENNVSGGGLFGYCTALTTINAPKLKFLYYSHSGGNISNNGCFVGCTALSVINFPSLQVCQKHTFRNCTGLTDVTFGSEGNAVTSIESNAFSGCTQSGLTITIYTNGGAALAGEPWDATNATIVYEEA